MNKSTESLSRPRLSILGVGDFPDGGATSQRLYLLARILNEEMGQTDVWVLHAASKTVVPGNSAVTGSYGGVRFRYLCGRTVRPRGLGQAILDTMQGIFVAARLLLTRSQRPDVLVIYTPVLAKFIVPLVLARLLRIPIIVEACEVFSTSTDVVGTGLMRRLANGGQALMERKLPAMASGLIVISRRIKDYYRALGFAEESIYLLPVLTDIERYQGEGTVVSHLVGEQYFLNSGSFAEKDGIAYLIDAMVAVRADYPGLKLVFTGFAGEVIKRNILTRAGVGGAGWIIFTGMLNRDELIWCYKRATGLLCCRSNSDYANYGFPTKLAEYLSCARPIIATRVGDVELYLTDGQNAFLAQPENVPDIAEAMRRLLRDPDRALSIGQRGAKVAAQWFDYRNHILPVTEFVRKATMVVQDLPHPP